MEIRLKEVSVRELVAGYENHEEGGVVGYDGRLNIRPPYQREFIYKEAQRAAVIDTVMKGFPLNVMYWAVCDDDRYEVIDGQQRTMSICEYVAGNFSVSVDGIQLAFHNLQDDVQCRILDYKLMVYFCTGTDSEKLEWFKTINIAGEELTMQELRNAVFSGSWVTDAKRYFSKTGCVASRIGGDYLLGSAIRQEYLETAIRWISNGDIDGYMSRHQHDANAAALWQYFNGVITWIESTFVHTKERKKIMKGLDWGMLYKEHHEDVIDRDTFDRDVTKLMLDDDVTKKAGIYPYLLTGKERYLSIRAFSPAQRLAAYEAQKGVCKTCGEHFEFSEMEGDHITPWHDGGRTVTENCQMLCRECNRRKSGK